jgi:Sec7-like guanine-nucleotide exchange factor
VNNEIKFAKKAHYMNACHENESNVKKTWGIINELTSKKQNNSHVKVIKLKFLACFLRYPTSIMRRIRVSSFANLLTNY